jgi:hypothetical protein
MEEVYSADDYLPFYKEIYDCPLINGKVNESFPCEVTSIADTEQLRRKY